jgi:hypothetical protein
LAEHLARLSAAQCPGKWRTSRVHRSEWGERLKTKASEVTIQFRPVPHQSFPKAAALAWQPNQPLDHSYSAPGRDCIAFSGQAARFNPASESRGHAFSFQETFKSRSPQAYETLLADVMSGDATFLMRADQVEASWSVLMPILNAWADLRPVDFPNYRSGTWGPEAAEALIAKDGRSWLQPILREGQEGNQSQESAEPTGAQVETGFRCHLNLYLFCCQQQACRLIPPPTPQLGEINTPRPMDAAEGCSLYDGFMAGILAWTNRVSEC